MVRLTIFEQWYKIDKRTKVYKTIQKAFSEAKCMEATFSLYNDTKELYQAEILTKSVFPEDDQPHAERLPLYVRTGGTYAAESFQNRETEDQ